MRQGVGGIQAVERPTIGDKEGWAASRAGLELPLEAYLPAWLEFPSS